MKYFALVAILFSALSSYELKFSKKFQTSTTKDILTTNITIKYNAKDKNYINNIIEEFQDFVNIGELATIKNKSYTLTPIYHYKNGIKYFKEFSAELNFKVETKNSDNINEFINELYLIKHRTKSLVDILISDLKWEMSSRLYDSYIDNLRIEAIDWIEGYSILLNKNCSIKSISLDKENKIESKNSLTKTNNKKEQIVLIANYKLECK